MKQKVVIRVTLNNGKNSPLLLGWLLKKIKINNGKMSARSKAMQIALRLPGVEPVPLQGEDSSQIVVVGDSIDSVKLATLLRKKVGFAEVTSVSPVSTECLFPNSVRPISLLGIKSKRLVDTSSIASCFPPDRSDTESDSSSESNQSSPQFSCFIDTIFPPAWSPSQSPPRISFSIETFFPPARSPSQSDSSENYEETRVVKALVQAEITVQAQDGNADDRAAEAGDKAAGKRPVVYL